MLKVNSAFPAVSSLRVTPWGSWDNIYCLPGSCLWGWSRTEPCRELEAGTAGGAPPQAPGCWSAASRQWQTHHRCHRRLLGACSHPLCVWWWCRVLGLLMDPPVGYAQQLWEQAKEQWGGVTWWIILHDDVHPTLQWHTSGSKVNYKWWTGNCRGPCLRRRGTVPVCVWSSRWLTAWAELILCWREMKAW